MGHPTGPDHSNGDLLGRGIPPDQQVVRAGVGARLGLGLGLGLGLT